MQDFRIQPSTVDERESMYEDLIEILTVGFVAHSVTVGGVPLSLRSLNSTDLYLLRHRCGMRTSQRTWDSWLLAQSIWMFDGQIVLEDPSASFDVYEMCKDLPKEAQNVLLHVMKLLTIRLNQAIELTESYSYEAESRFLWRSYGHKILERGGIPGAPRIGWSTVHRIWASYNVNEDMREDWMSRWTQTKLIASTQAPKGIKKLNNADEEALNRETRRRQSVQDKAYYKIVENIDLDIPLGGDGRYQDIRMAVTEEELTEEMRRARAGEKDEHDLVVDFYKRKVRDRIENERRHQRERVERIEREMVAAGVDEPAFRPMLMSGEDIARQLAQKSTRTTVYSNQSNELYNKYLQKDPVVGTVSVPKDGTPTATPMSSGEGTLQEQVARRKPTLGND